jgi:PII-like signaling protein
MKELNVATSTKLLRIYTAASAYVGDRKMSEYIVALAREQRLAGVTVLEALIGFGKSAHFHRPHVFESDRALVIEIVEEEAALRRFVASLEDVPDIGLITMEAVEIMSRNGASTGSEAP